MPIGAVGPVPITIGMIDPVPAPPNPGVIPGGRPSIVRARVDEGGRSGRNDVALRTPVGRLARTGNSSGARAQGAADRGTRGRIVRDGRADARTQDATYERAGHRVVVVLIDAILRRPAGIGVRIGGILLLLLISVGAATLLRSGRRRRILPCWRGGTSGFAGIGIAARLILLGGGLVIKVGDEVVGAIGAAGAPFINLAGRRERAFGRDRCEAVDFGVAPLDAR